METSSIGSDGTDELLTSLDPLLNRSNQLVLESSRDDKSFASTFRSSSRQETVRTNDSKSSDGRQSKLHDSESPRFDPRHATVAEILDRTDRQLKALSASRKSNLESPSPVSSLGPSRDQRQQTRKSAMASFPTMSGSDNTSRWSQNCSRSSSQEIIISRPKVTRSNGLKEAMDWSNSKSQDKHIPYLQQRESNHRTSLYHQQNEAHHSSFDSQDHPYLHQRKRHSSFDNKEPSYLQRENHPSYDSKEASYLHQRENHRSYDNKEASYLQRENHPSFDSQDPTYLHQRENYRSYDNKDPSYLHQRENHHSYDKQDSSIHPHIYSEPPSFLKKGVAEDAMLRQRLFDAEQKVSELERDVVDLREKCTRKDNLLQELDKNFADVLVKGKARESEKDESIMELRSQVGAARDELGAARRDVMRLQGLLAEAEDRLQQKDDATSQLMSEAQELRRRAADEANRLREELGLESNRKNDLLRRNQAMHEENAKLAKSISALEKSLEDQRLGAALEAKDLQARNEKQAVEASHLSGVVRKQDEVIGDLQRALRMAQSELERWKTRETDWAEEKKAMGTQQEAKRAEWEISMKRWEAELRAKHEKELQEERAAADVARSQAEQRSREAHRDEIHALTARQQKELAQLRERADEEISRRAAAAEEVAHSLRSELAAARERAEYYRMKGCESEAQRLRTLSQMQALMQASCSQALSVLSKPASFEGPPAPVRTVLEAVQEMPSLEPGEGLDIIDSLVTNGASGGSRPPSSVDLINLGSEKTASPAPL